MTQEKKAATTLDRDRTELLEFKNPFIHQFETSTLQRVDHASKYSNRLMVNHRQEGGLERAASAFAYDGQLDSAFHPGDLSPTAAALQDFIKEHVLTQKAFDKPPSGTRATITMTGNPRKSGMSWENPAQCTLALHLAAKLHQAGIVDEAGKLVSILISTPYSQATREALRMFNAMSDWEICKDRVSIRTIDGSQGSEYDMVIDCMIVEKGGFLWKQQRFLVALTRSRYAQIDIMSDDLLHQRGSKWEHFRLYKEVQKGANAITSEQRDWTKVDKRTFLPHSCRISPTSLHCFKCHGKGHHTRNCGAAPKHPAGMSLLCGIDS